MSGVGLIIILLQLFPLWDSIGKINIRGFAPTFSEFNIHAVALGILTVLILFNPTTH
jgi:SulP family sulfate permease